MAFEFVETLTLSMPDIEKQLSAFSEADYNKNHGLIVEVAAIHEGMTANFNFYPRATLEEALVSWTHPYPKPIIMNHDAYSEPVGRVMAAKMDQEADGTPYVRLQVAITDPNAISKVSDQRYLTGSVGGKAEEAICNICGADWAQASMFQAPCKHQRGTPYKGKVAHIEMRKIGFKEYSFVNMPADARSNVRTIGTATATGESQADEDGWIRAPRFFSLTMDNEEIVEFAESENKDLLVGKKKRDSSPIYHQLRGAFLSALAVEESDEELNVETETIEEEDILAITEDLSSDLANLNVENSKQDDDEAAMKPHAFTDANKDGKCDVCGMTQVAHNAAMKKMGATAKASDDDEVDDEQEEGTKPPGQETPNAGGDSDSPDSIPKNRESEDAQETDVEEDTDTTEETDDEIEELADENESVESLKEANAELEARYQTLLGENDQLKDGLRQAKVLLKQVLAERVVDTKIGLGLYEADERAALVEEHMKRSAASLKDSIFDLAKLPLKTNQSLFSMPTVEDKSGAVKEDSDRINTDGESDEDEPVVDAEDFFVDVFMNRKQLR